MFGFCAHAFAASVDSNSHIYIAEDSFACKFTLQNNCGGWSEERDRRWNY